MNSFVNTVQSADMRQDPYFSVDLEPLLDKFPGVKYQNMVRQIREAMQSKIPPNSAVLVASKGDYCLLRADGLRTYHFPTSGDGSYAGHHFADSKAAVAQLEELRQRGAEYFVLPETAYWWLDYYKEFAAHLDSVSQVVSSSETPCKIFRLTTGARAAQILPEPAVSGVQRGAEWRNRITEMAELVIPPGSSVLLAEDGSCPLELDHRALRSFPSKAIGCDDPFPDSAAAISVLEQLRQGGAQYIIFPSTTVWWLEYYEGLRRSLEGYGSLVALEPDICVIYALYRIRLAPPTAPARATAIMSVRNEERCLPACIEHYVEQGVQVYIIDNGSTDDTVAIAESYRGRGVVEVEHFPFDGVFRLHQLDKRKEEIAAALDTDWIIYTDPDECRFAPRPDWTLAQALASVEACGYNAVNFLEFVFIPTEESSDHDRPDFRETMSSYYFFLPRLPWRMSAWRRQPGGLEITPHRTRFPGVRLCPCFFPMRHYNFLSVPFAASKYGTRIHDPNELAAGHHGGAKGWREQYQGWSFPLPTASEMKIQRDNDAWDLSQPHYQHWIEQAFAARAKQGKS